MNIGGLFGALTPVFFVLALGYLAGKRNAFDADQSAGLSKLALTFALPASLFVSMTDIPKDLLLQQGRLVLALILSHAGLFVVAWVLLRMVKSLKEKLFCKEAITGAVAPSTFFSSSKLLTMPPCSVSRVEVRRFASCV